MFRSPAHAHVRAIKRSLWPPQETLSARNRKHGGGASLPQPSWNGGCPSLSFALYCHPRAVSLWRTQYPNDFIPRFCTLASHESALDLRTPSHRSREAVHPTSQPMVPRRFRSSAILKLDGSGAIIIPPPSPRGASSGVGAGAVQTLLAGRQILHRHRRGIHRREATGDKPCRYTEGCNF